MIIFVPGGANGVRLKSKAPWRWAYAESFVLIRDRRRRSKVSRQCSSNPHQRWTGIFLNAGKSCNKIIFERLDCSFRFVSSVQGGGTSWKRLSYSVMNFSRLLGTCCQGSEFSVLACVRRVGYGLSCNLLEAPGHCNCWVFTWRFIWFLGMC